MKVVGHCSGNDAAHSRPQVEGSENSPQTADEYQVRQLPRMGHYQEQEKSAGSPVGITFAVKLG
jgi:hypothetical protein